MKVVGFDEGERALTWEGVVSAIADGHRRPKAEIGDLLLRHSENSLLNRAAWIDGLGIAMKSVTVFPANVAATPPRPSIQGGVLLFDAETGALRAVVDGPLVTKWKTAADSVLGARMLARPGSRTLLICGAGTLARSLIDAYRALFPSIDRILIWNRTPEKAADLAKEFRQVGAEPAGDLEAAVGAADIVATATMARSPIIAGEWLRPGTHLDLIGAYRPDMREADDETMRRGRVFVDSFSTTIGHIGEIETPLQSGVLTRDAILGDLHALCAGTIGRGSAEEITIFKNGGGAHLDLMVAAHILEQLTAGPA